MKLKLIFLVVFSGIFLAGVKAQPPTKKVNTRPTKDVQKKKEEPFVKATVEEMAEKCIRFDTDEGIIEFELFPDSAPQTVRNFLNLTALGAFEMTTFSRVVPNFVIQGGSPSSRQVYSEKLTQRMNQTIPDEPNKIKHKRGIVSMARTDEPNSASSSFFILVRDSSHLDGTFAAFGKVTLGMETVDLISKGETVSEKPLKPVKIKKAEVFSCVKEKTN